MTRHTILAAALLLLSAGPLPAAFKTYQIIDHPLLQTDEFTGLTDHVTGTITTNGDLGSFHNFPSVSASFTLTDGSGHQFYVPSASIDYYVPLGSSDITLTEDAILLAPGGGFRFVGQVQGTSDFAFLQWINGNTGRYTADVQHNGQAYMGFGLNVDVGFGPGDWTIANQTGLPPVPDTPPTAVPEPASLTLLASGAASLLGYRLRRRKDTAP